MSRALNEAHGALPDFVRLAGVNRATNQAFFLEGYRHLISNPINSILMGGELLQGFAHEIKKLFDLLESEPKQLPFIASDIRDTFLTSLPKVVNGINASARRLNQFISHLSALTGNDTTHSRCDVEFNQLVSLCASMIDHRICRFSDNVHINLETGIPPVTANAQQILQVIISLLTNALLSLPDKTGEVVLSTSCNRETGQVQLCICDTGTGIPPDILPHVIEPFFTTWSKHGCLGLGLTVADRIIRTHGGKLVIDSEPGKGTSALVSLPVHENPSDSISEHSND